MKIFKVCISWDSIIERETQKIIDELFEKYPNGKIEDIKFNHIKATSEKFSTSILFETEPKEETMNPLLIHQIISELKGE